MPGVPSTMLNRVSGLGLSEPATEEHLDAIDEFFEPFGVQYAIATPPGAQPVELTGWLAERGFTSGYAWTKFSRGVEERLHVMTDLRVELAGPSAGADFALVVREAYEMPEEVEAGLAARRRSTGSTASWRTRATSRRRPACSSSRGRRAGWASARPVRPTAGGAARAPSSPRASSTPASSA